MSETSSQWKRLPPMTTQRMGSVALYASGKVFVVGGFNTDILDSIECYCIDQRRWTEIPSKMSTTRIGFAAAVIGSNLFIAGGYNGEGATLNTVEAYNVESGTWATFPPMSTNRYVCRGVAVGDEFFVIGGRESSSGRPLNTAEVFNVKTREWTDLRPMNIRRVGCAVAAIGGRIYVVGGSSTVDTVEVFDIERRRWSVLSYRIRTKRFGCAAVAVGSNIVVIGGRDVDTFSNTVEMYNTNAETWTNLPSLASERSGCAAVALGGTVYVMGGGGDRNSHLDCVEQINFSDGFVRDMLLGWSGGRWSSEVASILHWNASIIHEMEIHPSLMPTLLSRVGQEGRGQTIFELVKETMSLFDYTWTPNKRQKGCT